MELLTHKKFTEVAISNLNIKDKLKNKIIEQSIEPDLFKYEVNNVLSKLFFEYPILTALAKKYNFEELPYIHNYKKIINCVNFLGKSALFLYNRNDKKNAYRLYAWAIHFLVDCGTPYHEINATNVKHFFFSKYHQRYETYLDENIDYFQPFIEAGYKLGFETEKKYKKMNLITLTNFAKEKNIKISASFNKIDNSKKDKKKLQKNSLELQKISEKLLLKIGKDLGRFTKTFQLENKKKI